MGRSSLKLFTHFLIRGLMYYIKGIIGSFLALVFGKMQFCQTLLFLAVLVGISSAGVISSPPHQYIVHHPLPVQHQVPVDYAVIANDPRILNIFANLVATLSATLGGYSG